MYDDANWRKPRRSYSSGGCLEAANWRTPRRSNGNSMCVEAGNGSAVILVRDTKQDDVPGRTVLAFTGEAWRAFAGRVKRDEAVAP